ncbi:vitamin K epoxide reductase family protein [Cellulosimicrobium protaetiae]|uniref:Vitamin K epoxide reductase family protein n=2 Tax=Cellulosimicrobium protaetiae TaxID=2587808 RepID=A0A6M5ULY3_9MICO|nr:vitamin K epoxide reductase family protein [Cellulosimicrobium protaetiae]
MGWLLVVLGAIGLFGSAALAIEKFLKLADPNHVPSCSINALLDCGDAMDSWQGSLLGFPNPLLGIAAFPVVITTGVVVLVGARLPRWYWLALLGGTTLGMGLVVFLVWTTMYAISAMCPYCMVVWFAMLPLFWYQVVHAVQEGYLPAGDGVRRTLVGNRHLFLAIGYVALVAWIFLVKGPVIISMF